MNKVENKDRIVLETRGLIKYFPGVIALKGIDFDLRIGEVHALVGQNGAGKTTFLRIINGIIRPDGGEIYVNGKKVVIKNPRDAKDLGITLVHQESTLFPNLSVAENIFIASRLYPLKFRFLNHAEMFDEAMKYLEMIKIKLDPRTKIRDLSTAHRQLIQVARAIAEGANIICLDEPTSALTEKDVKHLFEVMHELRERGISFIFVTHRIPEIFDIADRVTILRDGQKIATKNIHDVDEKEVIKLMLGRELSEFYIVKEMKENMESRIPLLEVYNLRTISTKATEISLKGISFSLYSGEVLGVVGLLGAGKSELGKALVGLQKIVDGKIKFNGKEVQIKSPVEAKKYGIYYLPEDRLREGLILLMSVKDNIVLPSISRISKMRIMRNLSIEKFIAENYIKQLNIVTPSLYSKVETLSGGNKQKVLIAKALEIKPTLIILDEPTFGIDIGAKIEIRKIIRELSGRGMAIILLTSDIDEALTLSDRILILSEGRQIGLFNREALTRERVIELLGGE